MLNVACMGAFETDDFVMIKVPESHTTSGLKLSAIFLGSAVVLSVFYVGSEVTESIGFTKALSIFFIVNSVLFIFNATSAIVGNRARLSTYMILHFSFGKKGVQIINLMMGLVLLGWYAVTVEILGRVMADSCQQILNTKIPIWSASLGCSVIMTVTAIYGFSAIKRISSIGMPFLILFLLSLLYMALHNHNTADYFSYTGNGRITLGNAIGSVIGISSLSFVMMPDFTRFSKNDKASLLAIFSLTIGIPLVMAVGGMLTIITGEIDMMKIMISIGFAIPALIILFFSTWIINTANLYSAELTLSTVFNRVKSFYIIICSSLISTSFAIFGITKYFIDFLNVVSAIIPPIAAIYIADFFFIKNQKYELADIDKLPGFDKIALGSWIVAATIGYLSAHNYISFTTISFLDGFFTAFVLYIILKRFQNHCV